MTNRPELEDITLSILVMPYKGAYLAMCYETGVIRQGSTLIEARDAIFSATDTLVEAVRQNHDIQVSLSVGLPLRYRLLFNFTVLRIITRVAMQKLVYLRQPLSGFEPAFG